ncbi:MAG: PAS domain S-box protein [Spirochaetales bacterium]|nr:PAS domain S-box protein [Spirochaetales bacterium]
MENSENKTKIKKLIRFSYKITIGILIILILFISFLTFITIERERALMNRDMNREKTIIAEMTARYITSEDLLESDVLKMNLMKIEADNPEIYFCRIVKTNGEIYLSTLEGEKGKFIDNFSLMSFIKSKIITQEYKGEQINVVLAQSYLNYMVMIGYSLNTIQKAINGMIVMNASISVIIILVIVILSFVITTKMVQPVKELTKGAAVIGNGNLDYRINIYTRDEIGLLAESFNKMTVALKKTTVSKDYMDSVLNNMIDTLLVTGPERRISMINKSACKLLGYSQADLLGMPGDRLFKTRNNPFNGSGFRELLAAGVIRNREDRIVTGQAREIPVLISASVIQYTNGELRNIICVIKDITEQKKSEEELNAMHKKLLHSAHQAGMGEIAIGILHNIGNILTSAGVSAETIAYSLKKSKITGLLKANELIKNNKNNRENFLLHDPKGKYLPDYYIKVGEMLGSEHETLEYEIAFLLEKITMIKNVIDTQQEYAFPHRYMEQINLISIINDTLKIEASHFKKHEITINIMYPPYDNILIMAQKTKVVDILVNCFKNAWEAMQNIERQRELCIKVVLNGDDTVAVHISDNGNGISDENLKKIFTFGFTTKEDGYGFGLHSCAIFMSEMGGNISAASSGPGKGTTFTLVFPLVKEEMRSDE